jgi:hypothetical protein
VTNPKLLIKQVKTPSKYKLPVGPDLIWTTLKVANRLGRKGEGTHSSFCSHTPDITLK